MGNCQSAEAIADPNSCLLTQEILKEVEKKEHEVLLPGTQKEAALMSDASTATHTTCMSQSAREQSVRRDAPQEKPKEPVKDRLEKRKSKRTSHSKKKDKTKEENKRRKSQQEMDLSEKGSRRRSREMQDESMSSRYSLGADERLLMSPRADSFAKRVSISRRASQEGPHFCRRVSPPSLLRKN